MSAEEFLADVEGSGIHRHEDVLRIAFIYMDEGLWNLNNGVFDVVEELHARGLSFGEGELRFNRTLDIFYLAQIAAAIYRWTSQLTTDDFPSPEDFPAFYTTHRALLHSAAWRDYYSPAFLAQPATARFYRLPSLQDLPDSDSPLCMPRTAPASCSTLATKVPRWAYTVARTYRRQASLPLETFTRLALSSLETTTARLREAHPSVPPYSEAKARFWLERLQLGSPDPPGSRAAWRPNRFGELVAQGALDVFAWEASEAGTQVAGSVQWCGWPDGGTGAYSWWRGWDGEVGSEEEVEFLAALAVEETVGVDMGELDLAMRSHVLLGVLRAAVEGGREREVCLEELEAGMVAKGRITNERAGSWLREALVVVEPYVRIWEGVWPDIEERGKLLRQILVDNGQLFARWKVSPPSKEFTFELGPRE